MNKNKDNSSSKEQTKGIQSLKDISLFLSREFDKVTSKENKEQ